MGIGTGALTLYCKLIKDKVLVPGQQSMIELGSQDLFIDYCPDLVKQLFEVANVPCPSPFPDSGRSLMLALGFQYSCIDIDGRHDAMPLNLNKLLIGLEERFDVVTNHGTTEHCFDQGNCFRNMHNLCKCGGVMIHVVPAGGHRKHGFYIYDTNLFVDLSEANGYDMNMWLTVDDLSKSSSAKLVHWEQFASWSNNSVCICAVLRKTSDAPLRVPIQKIYQL